MDDDKIELEKVPEVAPVIHLEKPSVPNLENALNDTPSDTKEEPKKKEKHNKKGFYLSFSKRVLILCILLVICTFFSTIFVIKSLKQNDAVIINYTEKSNINYFVYLKNNNFYESEFLDEDMVYVSSLIDRINIVFNYNFAADRDVPLDFTYDVNAKVVIYDESEKNIYFEKKYNLIKENTVSIEEGKYRNISEAVDIDYAIYNKVANEFKNTYGLDTVSKLIVELDIHKTGENINTDITSKNSTMSLTVPLSERSVDIKTDYKDIDNQSSLVSDFSISIGNVVYMVIAVILFVGACFFAYKLIKLLVKTLPKRNLYDEYIDKIFKEYDRLVVRTTSKPDVTNNSEVINVLTFQELLDVRDNVKSPIMYYPIHEHSKGLFYIKVDKLIYILKVKKVDIDNKKIK